MKRCACVDTQTIEAAATTTESRIGAPGIAMSIETMAANQAIKVTRFTNVDLRASTFRMVLQAVQRMPRPGGKNPNRRTYRRYAGLVSTGDRHTGH